MRRLELLAPAKNLESGIAAIDHGADAVYIGASRFGARVAASNSVDDIRQLCAYAHLFGAKVYVTVNTIVYDQELAETYQLLDSLEEAGADAVLVQDMAVADYLLNKQGRMDIHASTQTDNRTTEKVRWLAHQGFSRVVLARELSVEEISQIHKNVPDVELEVFVHGALCVSYSGLCYASQYCFGRSANRGECAQFCRMKFDLLDAAGNSVAPQRYYLSLKDMNQSDELQSLIEAGATSFKIEGRLKDITYVKNVTAAYSELLNAFIARNPGQYERASRGHCTYTFKPDLRKSFNRGYTHYFLKGRQPDIASFDTPKAIGEYVGKVKEIRGNTLSVAGLASFANGDGLCFLNDKRELEGFRVNKVEGNKLSLLKMPSSLRTGAALYRNNDQEFERLLSRPSAKRKIPVKMSFTETPIGYRFSMDGVSLDVEAEHVMAKSPQRDNVIRQLTKLGDTPYECVDFTIDNDFSFFIPSSQLTIIRREMVEKYQLESNLMDSKTTLPATSSSLPEPYSPTYLYNISNGKARVLYERQGLVSPATAFEIEQPKGEKLLMQCRHCIRYSLGYCVKRGGKQPIWHEPLYLRLSDGRRFRLAFHCHHCQMNVYAENH